MKRIYHLINKIFAFGVTFILVTSLIISCTSHKQKGTVQDNLIKIDTFSMSFNIDSSFVLEPSNKYSPEVDYSIRYRVFTGDSLLTSTINKMVFDSLTAPTVKTALHNWVSWVIRECKIMNKNWKKDLDSSIMDTPNPTQEKRPYAQVTEINMDIFPTYITDSIISYEKKKYVYYYNAAHGLTEIKLFSVWRNPVKVITESDIFEPGYKTKLGALIVEELEKKYGVNNVKDLSDNAGLLVAPSDIVPNGNFYLNEEGITYCYNEYEIAAYSAGYIKVTIPWDKLRPIINPYSSIVTFFIDIE